jgi:hypothetical protein
MIFHPTSGEADGDGQKDMGDLFHYGLDSAFHRTVSAMNN